jgi:poly-gamma-glutamate synthesis protein (capsule biosynthesis protein)
VRSEGAGATLFLCGESDPGLHEAYSTSALDYVRLAERLNGTIPAPVDFAYIWGEALRELDRVAPDTRIVNLETSVTTSSAWEPGGINYRMHPRNVPCLTAAGIDCCVLANNHVLDWGPEGLDETVTTLRSAGLQTAGAGRTLDEARRPAILETDASRVLVFAFATESSGVPRSWGARQTIRGVSLLQELSDASADLVAAHVRDYRREGDIAVVSIHWGSNWGYQVPESHQVFAHRLIDSGEVDVIHGHSSHHPRGVEVYGGKLILYGCGDFLNDYEGISGYEEYRDDLTLMYFVTLDAEGLTGLRMVPMQLRRFRLWRASESDAQWLQRTLDRESAVFGTRVKLEDDGSLAVPGD